MGRSRPTRPGFEAWAERPKEAAAAIQSDPGAMLRRLYRRRFSLPFDSPLLDRPAVVLVVEMLEENHVAAYGAGADEDGAEEVGTGSPPKSAAVRWDDPHLTGDSVVDEWELAITRGDDIDLERKWPTRS